MKILRSRHSLFDKLVEGMLNPQIIEDTIGLIHEAIKRGKRITADGYVKMMDASGAELFVVYFRIMSMVGNDWQQFSLNVLDSAPSSFSFIPQYAICIQMGHEA